ncbi:MAG: polyphosphate polymerase domain-containing protein [Gemmatimonadetes bacterium]|jgi:hypothetical protein|nr:polyphosphate polymerase domain-containing protein [Gemmatimonadota bacterium]MBT7859042.1 polyphosphate polymerase domain-containing protein [Gemmatimonadota bacterium]
MKYTVSESQAVAIRDYIQPIFTLDRHAAAEQGGYVVNNVYLDTPGLRFYYDTKFRRETRLKPRVRYYGQEPEDFVILEVKHRHNTISWKRRQQISTHEWPGVLDVSRSERETPRFIRMPETFEEVNHLYCTAPVVHVRYFREPYVSDIDAYGRITFDRSLRYRLALGSSAIGGGDEDMTYYGDQAEPYGEDSPVVLEIKTEAFVPLWATDLIRRFGLVQRGYSKYCYVIDACLENGYDAVDLAL